MRGLYLFQLRLRWELGLLEPRRWKPIWSLRGLLACRTCCFRTDRFAPHMGAESNMLFTVGSVMYTVASSLSATLARSVLHQQFVGFWGHVLGVASSIRRKPPGGFHVQCSAPRCSQKTGHQFVARVSWGGGVCMGVPR